MKMNWGNSIVLVFVLFAAFILYMVVRAFQEDFDLVTEDYYAQEIGYQKKIEQKSNLEAGERIVLRKEDESIHFSFPKDQLPEGEIHFYHQSQKALDKRIAIKASSEMQQVVSLNKFIQGYYRINITWESDGVDYFQQEKIYIQ